MQLSQLQNKQLQAALSGVSLRLQGDMLLSWAVLVGRIAVVTLGRACGSMQVEASLTLPVRACR